MKSVYLSLIDRCVRLVLVFGFLSSALGLPANTPLVAAAGASQTQSKPVDSGSNTEVPAPLFTDVSNVSGNAPALAATAVITSVSPANMTPLGLEKVAAIASTGGDLISADTAVKIHFPAQAVADQVSVHYQRLMPLPANQTGGRPFMAMFNLSAQ